MRKLKVTKDVVSSPEKRSSRKTHGLVKLAQTVTVDEFYNVYLQAANMALLKKAEVPETRKLLWR